MENMIRTDYLTVGEIREMLAWWPDDAALTFRVTRHRQSDMPGVVLHLGAQSRGSRDESAFVSIALTRDGKDLTA